MVFRRHHEARPAKDPHIELTLLRNCFAPPKFSFALRTVDTCKHKGVLEDFDRSVKEALEAIIGVPLPPLQYDQAVLPVSLGGLGLRQAQRHAAAAYLASVGDTAALVQDIRMQLQDWVGLQEGEGTQLGGEGAAEVRPGTQEGGEEIAAEVRPGIQQGGEGAAVVRPGTEQGGEVAAVVRPGSQQVGLARTLEDRP